LPDRIGRPADCLQNRECGNPNLKIRRPEPRTEDFADDLDLARLLWLHPQGTIAADRASMVVSKGFMTEGLSNPAACQCSTATSPTAGAGRSWLVMAIRIRSGRSR
jgi:hypothetical protein